MKAIMLVKAGTSIVHRMVSITDQQQYPQRHQPLKYIHDSFTMLFSLKSSAAFLTIVSLLFLSTYLMWSFDDTMIQNKTTLAQLNADLIHSIDIHRPDLIPPENLEIEQKRHMKSNSAENWYNSIFPKITCLRNGKGSILFYHMRKAGGTTIRDWIQLISRHWRVELLEIEGKSMNQQLYTIPSVLTITSFRPPIDRIMSLYWYEHVAWWNEVKHEMARCKTLSKWVDGWRDGSEWKSQFVKTNPSTVYVEVENYYIKSLVGWDGTWTIGEKDLQLAKQRVDSMDVILLTQDLSLNNRESLADVALFFSDNLDALRVRSNSGAKPSKHLVQQLAADQVRKKKQAHFVHDLISSTPFFPPPFSFSLSISLKDEVQSLLFSLNALDMQLYEYVIQVVSERRNFARDMLERVTQKDLTHNSNECPILSSKTPIKAKYRADVGLFRPIGHKGPLER
jgi:hypothetical protein